MTSEFRIWLKPWKGKSECVKHFFRVLRCINKQKINEYWQINIWLSQLTLYDSYVKWCDLDFKRGCLWATCCTLVINYSYLILLHVLCLQIWIILHSVAERLNEVVCFLQCHYRSIWQSSSGIWQNIPSNSRWRTSVTSFLR